MPREELTRIERLLLVHLLDHRGNQVRFEADQWTTEFGIARKFVSEDPADLKNAMRALENSRMIYRRTQYASSGTPSRNTFSPSPPPDTAWRSRSSAGSSPTRTTSSDRANVRPRPRRFRPRRASRTAVPRPPWRCSRGPRCAFARPSPPTSRRCTPGSATPKWSRPTTGSYQRVTTASSDRWGSPTRTPLRSFPGSS